MDNLFLLFFFPLETCANQLAAQIAYSFFLQIFAAILKNFTYFFFLPLFINFIIVQFVQDKKI